MNERRIHQLFEISVLLKGAHALIECLGGLVLALVSTESILRLANRITQPELLNDPHDFIATHLLTWAQDFSVGTKNFYAYYLLSHGLVKVLLVIGLLRGKMWAYPASLAALGLFIVYQLYRFTDTHGIGLIILTIFDLVVMVLIWQEYKVVRHHVPTQKTSG
ncbi:putative membrane protein [Rhizobium sp. ERR 922]|uniref:DUF2127 domain-containing protein n=1 Tax=unclassified Rhizobium TaxID=2613769 RepID=UPI0011A1BA27|nr:MULTISPECIES: DUF2127 domain-containing protein [unclassified Rhizobium]TWB55381.1 putative membrane protein [Rhizobium sp. ERR 922]TWB97284.1 putative membrane protein [Rhizobium sp. ERR 942]